MLMKNSVIYSRSKFCMFREKSITKNQTILTEDLFKKKKKNNAQAEQLHKQTLQKFSTTN